MGSYWWYITVLLRVENAVPEENEEVLCAAAEVSGSIGTELQELPDGIRMRIYYRADKDVLYWRGRLLDALKPQPSVRIEDIGKIENQAWYRQSEDAFPPLSVGRSLVVLAPWHIGSEPPGRTPVYINPGSAFGTGYHESTQAALELLERHLERTGPCARVIDVGAGSGILSIAALKLGAGSAKARDIDPAVIAEIMGNLKLNHISRSRADVETGSLLSGVKGPFGLMLANILLEPLLEMLPSVRGALAPGGVAIFSGMTSREREIFMNELSRAGLEAVDEITKEEWWGVAAKNPA